MGQVQCSLMYTCLETWLSIPATQITTAVIGPLGCMSFSHPFLSVAKQAQKMYSPSASTGSMAIHYLSQCVLFVAAIWVVLNVLKMLKIKAPAPTLLTHFQLCVFKIHTRCRSC